jgi:hypothetical protein
MKNALQGISKKQTGIVSKWLLQSHNVASGLHPVHTGYVSNGFVNLKHRN